MKLNHLPQRLRNVVVATKEQMRQAQLLLVASSLAYTTILSIIPALAVSFAIFHAFGGMNKLYGTIEPLILSNLAEGSSEEVIATLHRLIDNAHASAIGVGGLVGLIFTTMSMLSSIEKAINRVWNSPLKRSFFQRISSYWFFITLGPLALSIILGFVTSSDLPLSQFLPSGTGLFLIAVCGFYLIYKYVPHCKVQWRYALISAVTTALVWSLARKGFSLYTSKAVSYQNIYGSLGAIPILLLWIYIIWLIILGGASLTAALQGMMERSSTSVLQRPSG